MVPSFADLAGELDGTLTPARHGELAAELTRSPAAREALADLAAFRDELAGLPIKQHRAEDSPTNHPTADDVNKVIIPSRWRWRTAASWAAGVAALFVALAMGSWMFTRDGQRPADLLRDASGQAAELAGLPAGWRESVETAARTGQLPPQGPTPATRGEIMAGQIAGVQMTAVYPVGIVVREPRPALRWTPREGATGYAVSCSSTDGGPLMTSPLLPAGQTQWVPPEALQDLPMAGGIPARRTGDRPRSQASGGRGPLPDFGCRNQRCAGKSRKRRSRLPAGVGRCVLASRPHRSGG